MTTRIQGMTTLQLWVAMCTKGVAAWKHKIMSDEFERRRKRTKDLLGLFKYET